MSDLINETIKVLAPWPLAQGFFILVIAFLGIMAIRRGDKDRKTVGPAPAPSASASFEMPMYLAGGPVHDALGAVHDIAEESRKMSVTLKDIDDGQAYTHKLLEAILRNQELRPDIVPTVPPRPARRG